ncbi:MAG: DEAD/DEAH box helicase, partial [Myxococcota bacterium]
MGLGKTVQAVAVLCRRAADGPAIVVAPLSVASNWVAELARFAPGLEVVRYRGASRAAKLAGLRAGQVVVATWDLVARDAELTEVRWATAILDEAQAIKNPHTARAKGAARLTAGFVLGLTGTPVENRTEELWSLLRVVVPGLLGSEARFAKRFAGPIDAGVPGARDALARLVRPVVLRRTKSQVATDLPTRTEVVLRVPLSADQAAVYERARLEAVARSTGGFGPGQRFEALRWLTVLRQLACDPRLVDPGSPIGSSKLETLRRRLADLRATGHRALVFSQFVRHLELVRDALVADGFTHRWLTGSSSEQDRIDEVARFQAGEGDVFLISLTAGGTGLNLTAATYVFHLDPWWNPAREDQASDRAHRIGQTRPVTVYRLVAEGTIEDRILALHAEKRELADALLSGADGAARVSLDELMALLS